MKFSPTPVAGCVLVKPDRHYDDRGFLQECFESDKYSEGLEGPVTWSQVNLFRHKQGVRRGLHVAPYSKLITCVSGDVWCVVADVRPGSPSFLEKTVTTLADAGPTQIYVPPGCAVGTFSRCDSDVLYLMSGRWAKEGEDVLSQDEPNLKVDWPAGEYSVSDRDREGNPLWVVLAGVPDDNYYSVQDRVQQVWVDSLRQPERDEWLRKHDRHNGVKS